MEGIKNIIFDLGGVLTGLDGHRCIDAFDAIGCENISYYVKYHLTQDLFYDIEIGNITTLGFCDEVRRMTGKDISNEQVIWAWNQLLTGISKERLERLLLLCNKYRLFLLSNTNDMHWQLCKDEFFAYHGHQVIDIFDQVFVSYEMHLAKPNKEIFAEVLRQANIQPAETLFIDDSQVNLDGAASLGIRGYLNKHVDDWLKMDL